METYEVMGIKLELTAGKASEIEGVFSPYYSQINELNAEFEKLEKEELTPETAKKAGVLRKKYVPLRTGSEKARKSYKSDVLKLSKAIDSIGNLVKDMATEKESILKEKENYLEVLEAERLENLKASRLAELEKYNVDLSGVEIEKMTVEMWEIFLNSQKIKHEAEKLRKKEEFLAKLKKDKEDLLHKERTELLIPIWNYLLSDEKSLNFGTIEEYQFCEIYAYSLDLQIEFQKEQERIKKENETLRLEQKKQDELRRIEKEKQDKILAKERADKQKLERELEMKENKEKADLKAKQDKEIAERERKEAEELALRQAPDKEKFNAWLNHYLEIGIPEFSDEKFMSLAVVFQERVKSIIKDFESKL